MARLIVAVPVAPRDTAATLQSDADEFVCLFVPEFFDAVGSFYKDFSQTPDEAVIALLDQAMKRQATDSPRIGQVKSYEKSNLFS